MKLAFCLFKYFPFGGLQRDFLRILKECQLRGHEVDVYTMSWEGERDPSFSVHVLPVKGLQNHSRSQQFAKQVKKIVQTQKYDLVVGFNKMPGLDVYYAADTCYQAKFKAQRAWWHSFMPRYRHLMRFEKAVFDKNQSTHILLIAQKQQQEFQSCYQTQTERFHLLPPGISKDHIAPENANEIRQAIRKEWNIGSHDLLLLLVGSGFKTKGLDRALKGLATLPKNTFLFVIGEDHAESFKRQAENLNILDRVRFLGGRPDVPDLMLAADLLVHPAYNENTGTVLLEAVVAQLPVLTTDVCGYADYIKTAEAGIVLPSPFSEAQFNENLLMMLTSTKRLKWQQNAALFAKTADIYSLPERAVDILETLQGDPQFLKFDEIMQLRGEVYRELEGRCTQRFVIKNQAYFIKQHKGIGWKEVFKNLIQGRLPVCSAKNEWEALAKLKTLQIKSTEVVGYGSKGFNPAALQSYLVTKELPKTISLENYQAPNFNFKINLIRKVAEIARVIHNNGINHRDFYICHFLMDEQSELYLIDLHRAQIRKKIPLRWRIKDLAGLYFSSKKSGLTKRDLLRFMKEYTKLPLRTLLNDQSNLWKKVKHRGEKLYEKHNRSF